jgi:transcriptional regulator with XRE-family HTH domain
MGISSRIVFSDATRRVLVSDERSAQNVVMDFPANLKRFRELRQMTQEQLAHASGMGGQSRIGNYEKGIREPKLEEIQALAQALGVSVPELIGVEGPEADMRDIAAALVAICDLLGSAMPKAAEDLAKRIRLLTGDNLSPERLAVHLLHRLQPPAHDGG